MTLKELEEKLKSIRKKGSYSLPFKDDDISIDLSINTGFRDIKLKFMVSVFDDTRRFFWKAVSLRPSSKNPSRNLNTQDIDFVRDLLKGVDCKSIFESILPICEEDLSISAPYYSRLLDSCNWVEELGDNATLSVGYNSMLDMFDLYYNPSFILLGSCVQYMYRSKDFKSLKDCIIYMTKFYLIHEMSHITRMHVQGLSNDLDTVSPYDINVLGDSYINLTIPTLIDSNPNNKSLPVIGITNEINRVGIASDKFRTLSRLNNTIQLFCQDLLGDDVKYDGGHSSIDYSLLPSVGSKCVFTLTLNTDPISLGITNSNIYIKAIDNLFKNLIDRDSTEKDIGRPNSSKGQPPQGQSSQSQSSQGQSSQSQSSQGQSQQSQSQQSQSSQGQSQQSQSQQSQSQQGKPPLGQPPQGNPPQGNTSQGNTSQGNPPQDDSSDDSGVSSNSNIDDIIDKIREQNDLSDQGKYNSEKETGQVDTENQIDNMSEEDKKAISDKVKEAIQLASKNGSTTNDLKKQLGASNLDSLDLDIISTDTRSEWKKKLKKALNKALGITERYDPNMPSSRIEGQFGREIEVTKVKSIAILMDCSGSMGPKEFQSSLKEIETMSKSNPNIRKVKVEVVYWGSKGSGYHRRYKLNNKLYDNMVKDHECLGGTDLTDAFSVAMTTIKRPDLMIVCTDGEISREVVSTDIKRYISRLKGKLIWVLTPSARPNDMELIKYDPNWKRNSIKPTSKK